MLESPKIMLTIDILHVSLVLVLVLYDAKITFIKCSPSGLDLANKHRHLSRPHNSNDLWHFSLTPRRTTQIQ